MRHLTPGTLLADRYAVGDRLGAGGGGEVWAADDTRLGRRVAIKVVPEGDGGERLQREARAAAGVNHPNVVQVYDAGAVGGLVYLVMEFVEGVDLAALLAATGPLDPEAVAVLGHDLARGLARVHTAGLVHRDVKPANVLVTPDGRAKLADLGIARRLDGDATRQVTAVGTVMGTIDYLAPEQLLEEEVGPATDVYALALVLHHACAGRPPFGDGTPAERAARRLARDPEPLLQAPDVLADAVAAAATRDPEARPVAGELGQLLVGALPVEVDSVRSWLGRMVRTCAAGDAVEPVEQRDGPPPPPRDATRVLPVPQPAVPASPRPAAPSPDVVVPPVPDGPSAPPADLPPPAARDDHPPDGDRDEDHAPDGWQDPDAPLLGDEQDAGPGPAGWLGRAVALLVAVGAAVTLVASLGGGDEGGDRRGEQMVALDVVGVTSHDPDGDGSEHEQDTGAVLDGDAETVWDTESYTTPDWGGFDKAGVGLVLDLGQVREVDGVNLRMASEGTDVVVVVSDAAPEGDPTDAGTVLGSRDDLPAQYVRISGDAARGRYVTVWLTLPGRYAGDNRGAVAEVSVTG